MIEKEKFISALDVLRKYENFISELNKLGVDITYNEDIENLVETYTELLAEAADDRSHWIAWFIYDSDYGQNEKCNFYIKNGVTHFVRNSEELYNLLLEEHLQRRQVNKGGMLP